MSPEDLPYTVGIILFLDFIILVSLSYYFKKLSFQFLRFGRMAMAAEMVAQVAFFSWAANQTLIPLILVGSVAKFAYAILIIVSLARMMGRSIPFKLMTACTLFYLVNAIYSRTVGDDITLHWVLGEVGPIVLLCTGIYYLISSRDSSLPK
jgi:fatty acid desaturase